MAEWKAGRFNDSHATLAPGLSLSVVWDATRGKTDDEVPPYVIYVFGGRIKARAKTIEQGHTLAVTVARKWLEKALKELPPEATA